MKLWGHTKKMPLPLAIILLLAALGGGFWAGYAVKPSLVASTQSIREDTDEYTFIHPLLAVNRADIGTPSPAYQKLADSVKDFIAKEKTAGLTDASVYFIDYGKKSGSFAFNEKEKYAPASLLKVVIMVAYLKKSDTDPAILSKEFVYEPGVAEGLEPVAFEAPSALSAGRSYTVMQLIDAMIAESDNGAMNLLLSNIEDPYLSSVYKNLGLSGPDDSSYLISVADYSLFLRILYNASYLSKTSSEKALVELSKATFADGLLAGVPKGTLVAHKFGEHVNGTGDTISSVELHDCGLVYIPEGPYLLCVMTKGSSLDVLKETIAGISKLAYDAAR